MQITNRELVGSFLPSLVELAKIKVSGKVAYAAARTTKAAIAAEEAYMEARKQVIETRCERDENDQPIVENEKYKFGSDEVEKEVVEELRKLEGEEVTVAIHTVKAEELDGSEIEPGILIGLLDFIQE